MSIRTRSLPEGTAIGDYRLLGIIGTGSMGEAFGLLALALVLRRRH